MFLGTHYQRLDDKGRLILPAKFREELKDGLVLTRGQEHCLTLFSLGEFEAVHEEMRKAPMTKKEARDYLRVFLSGAASETPDKQGRITVPQILRRYAGLDRDIAVIGMGNRAEIWDAPTWERYLSETEGGFAERDDEVIPGIL
ncbi:division/cell wall cluster transcriptional repressor MraZ [Sediminivirga luteola]|uniref:Transcriptional regulator MraZ n=1 Tax=Sediminivirga luteola TaxID=1774748 RepID=A0A8J2TZI6_9MICO|nr:division/cell wall cluster transcriptional repressor MraZ [Sediminivirga luteola]MCI2267060.1 division/cell wall cluster transcriptional repressor MraZ [Sediminivirga luteola]GGA21146.1 transcriptional regulator MraZ [Sediminivirga luteola]